MGKKLIILGRSLFFALLGVQCVLLALYPVNYGEDEVYSALAAIYALAPIAWAAVYYFCSGRDQVRWLWLVWLFYLIALVVMIGVIFGRIVIENKLDKKSTFGSNTLKSALCIAPGEMLLLLNTATGISEYQSVLAQLSVTATLDLFDGIEMLEVIIENSEAVNATSEEMKNFEGNEAISKKMKQIIVGFVCAFFLISTLELLQFKFVENNGIKEAKVRKRMLYVDSLFEFLLNICFLVLRIILWVDHAHEASIFITKNVISLVLIIIRVLFACGVVENQNKVGW